LQETLFAARSAKPDIGILPLRANKRLMRRKKEPRDDPVGRGVIYHFNEVSAAGTSDCTIYHHRMGLRWIVACILDPNHGCIRRIVVEVIQ
jgi:hypothetical protein